MLACIMIMTAKQEMALVKDSSEKQVDGQVLVEQQAFKDHIVQIFGAK